MIIDVLCIELQVGDLSFLDLLRYLPNRLHHLHLHRPPPAPLFCGTAVGLRKQMMVVETLRLESLFLFRLLLLRIVRPPVCVPLLTGTKLSNRLGKKRGSDVSSVDNSKLPRNWCRRKGVFVYIASVTLQT